MKEKRNIIQLTLILIGLIFILSTYILYPKIAKNKVTAEKQAILEDQVNEITDEKSNTFQNIQYKGIYNINKPFVIKSKEAHILKEDPDIVYMTSMEVIMHMNDGRVILINSDQGRYNKATYDCFFEDNVKATDGKTTLNSENLDLIASEDFANVYNNVILTSDESSLKADKILYSFESKYYHIAMNDKNKRVNIKIIK
jgi:hypothetical protein